MRNYPKKIKILKLKKENQENPYALIQKKTIGFNNELKNFNAMRIFQSLAKIESSNNIQMKNDKMIIMKQLEMIKKLKEEEKKEYEAQIEKIQFQSVNLKAKLLNKQYEDDLLLKKYQNTIQSIIEQYKKIGVKLNLIKLG